MPALPLFAFTCRNASFKFSGSHTSSINRSVRAGCSVPLAAEHDSVSFLSASRASPVSAPVKSSRFSIFCSLSSVRLLVYSPLLLVRALDHRYRLGLSVGSAFPLLECLTSLAHGATYNALCWLLRRHQDVFRQPQAPKRHGADL